MTESQLAMVGAKWAKLKRGANQHALEGPPIGGHCQSETKTRDEASKREIVAKAANGRQRGGQGGILLKENLPEAKEQTRDTLAAEIGVSGKTYEALGRRYNRTKRGVGRPKNSDKLSELQTAATIGRQHGVDEKTVRRAGQFAAAVDKLKAASPTHAPWLPTTWRKS
jgi:DNA invertase Pin-like site-specific DNA recombinase